MKVTVNTKGVYATTRTENAGPTHYCNSVKDGYHALRVKDSAKSEDARLRMDAYCGDELLCPVSDAGVPIVNLHRSTIYKYDGAGAVDRAHGESKPGELEGNTTGIMIHYVITEVDRGVTILVRKAKIEEGASLGDLEQKIHGYEPELIGRVTALLAERYLRPKGRKVSD
ncbi:phosphoribosylglycinamide formyltransferase [Hypoxylon sp. NC1633]|nr:phosphoribosylglycinamide formyltransferase [Hypoxylon sp. NC1633]